MNSREKIQISTYNICRDIFNESFQNAARSFGNFINRKVVFELENIQVNSNEDIRLNGIKKRKELMVYTTEIIGDFRGRSYFVLTNEEADHLGDCVSDKVDQSFLEAILLELDNILSASVITVLSNHIDAKIYGDVPQLHRMKAETLKGYVNDDKVHYDPSDKGYIATVVVKSKFIIDGNSSYTPGFIWKLPVGLLELMEQNKGNSYA